MLAGDIKKNVCLRLDGRIYVVIDFLHVKPGKGNTVMRTKLRDVQDGRVLERTWIVSAKLEDVQVDHRQFQYLYKEGDDLVFMNNETFEQVSINKNVIEGVDFLKEGLPGSIYPVSSIIGVASDCPPAAHCGNKRILTGQHVCYVICFILNFVVI